MRPHRRSMRNSARRNRRNRTTYFRMGEWNVLCDVTGFVRKSSEMRMTWDNVFSWAPQYDPKQPQLNIRGREDRIAVPITRPDQPIVFDLDVKPEDLP